MGIAQVPAASAGKTPAGQLFTNSSNWTAPSGVNYATVVVCGGGGGGGGFQNLNAGTGNSGGSGGTSQFGNLVLGYGGAGGPGSGQSAGISYVPNNGVAASNGTGGGGSGAGWNSSAYNAVPVYATVAVTPGTTYGITVGGGGAQGNFNGSGNNNPGGSGGSGFVSVEWFA